MYYTSPAVYEFISKQTNDPIVEWKTCRVSGTKFPIFQSDLEFYKKVSPTFGGKTCTIPLPSLCPEERQRRRLIFRNERKLYRRTCNASEKSIISIYSPDKPYKVYDQKIWRSDARDPMSYGREFDFSKTFTEQFGELDKVVPKCNTHRDGLNDNCEYANRVVASKNAYLSTDIWNCEDVYFCTTIGNSSQCIDTFGGEHNEYCYESKNIRHCHTCFFTENTKNCQKSAFLSDCENCSHCIFCTNLINKQYHIKNKPVTKEVFEKTRNDLIRSNSIPTVLTQRKEIQQNSFQKTTANYNCNECTGSDLRDSKASNFSFWSFSAENIKYCYTTGDIKDSYDCFETGINCHLLHETHALMYSSKSAFMNNCQRSHNCFYLSDCFDCENCFGCIGLRNKSYCIFNKQYTKDEYETLVPQIITHMTATGEWGEFFDPSLSPFGYNETVAQEYFPINPTNLIPSPSPSEKGDHKTLFSVDVGESPSQKDLGTPQGWKDLGGGLQIKWQFNSYDPIIPADADVLRGDQIPSDISTVTDDILKKVFVCEVSNRPFRLIKQELEFYRKHNLPLPRKHPDVRHEERLKQRPPRELHLRTCDKCGCEMVSVYPLVESGKGQVTSQKIYCETCYNREVYG